MHPLAIFQVIAHKLQLNRRAAGWEDYDSDLMQRAGLSRTAVPQGRLSAAPEPLPLGIC
jgi:hypothetical protein